MASSCSELLPLVSKQEGYEGITRVRFPTYQHVEMVVRKRTGEVEVGGDALHGPGVYELTRGEDLAQLSFALLERPQHGLETREGEES